MSTDPLRANDTQVNNLAQLIARGDFSLEHAPLALRRVIEGGCWRERTLPNGQPVRFERFEEFVTAKPIQGLGTTMKLVRRLCGSDPELLDMLDRATVGEWGGSRAKSDNVTLEAKPVTGNSPEYALRKLRRDAPDLHARVLAGEMTAHGAMVQAGFRKRTVSVAMDPESIARAAARHLDRAQLAALHEMIGEHLRSDAT